MNKIRQWILGVVCTCALASWAVSEECRYIDNCSCETDDSILDLHPLAFNNGTPRFSDVQDVSHAQPYLYSWNPCYEFSEGGGQPNTCQNVAVCQQVTGGTPPNFYGCGTEDSIGYLSDSTTGKLTLRYQQTVNILGYPQTRTTLINLTCTETVEGELLAGGEGPLLTYSFELRSKYACLKKKLQTTTGVSPTAQPAPGPGFFTIKTVVLLLCGIFFCLSLLVVLAVIAITVMIARGGRTSSSSDQSPSSTKMPYTVQSEKKIPI